MNLLDADCAAGKDGTEVNVLVTETDAAAIGDDCDFVMERIIDISGKCFSHDLRPLTRRELLRIQSANEASFMASDASATAA